MARKDRGRDSLPTARVQLADERELVRNYCEDPDFHGMTVPTRVAVPIGKQLVLELAVGESVFRAIGEVVWHRRDPGGEISAVSVRFVSMSPETEAWLADAAGHFLAARDRGLDRSRHLAREVQRSDELAVATDQVELGETTGAVLGIDLGTSNTAACILSGGRVEILDLRVPEDGGAQGRFLPSVVNYAGGSVGVGFAALRGLTEDPGRTVFGAKRFVGRAYESPIVQAMLSRFPYRVVSDTSGRVAVQIDASAIELTDVSARILRAVRERAERHLGRQITNAVITVPAYYNDNQRQAVVNAARLSGLTVARLLNEPTAAAVAYGATQESPRRLLIFDLGGGTFDVSIISACGKILQVLATAGDTFLGGEDFDERIVRHVVEHHRSESGAALSQNHGCLAAIKLAAERAKRQLTSHDRGMVTVRDAVYVDGSRGRLEVELTRGTFESLIEPLVDRMLSICDAAMHEAGLDSLQLVDVLLVGGQTRTPYVQQRVEQHFRRRPRCDINPDEAVALGAGMLGAPAAAQGVRLRDVLPMTLGIATGPRFKPVIPRNTALPHRRQIAIKVPRAKFDTLGIDVYQGEAAEAYKNEILGTIGVNVVDAGEADPVPIQIDFILSIECLLKVVVTNTSTGASRAVILEPRKRRYAA